MATKFRLKINNLRGDEGRLHLLMTAKSAQNISGIDFNTTTNSSKSIKFSDFKTSNPSQTISGEFVDAGRLYIGYGELPEAPIPEGGQYFGWIEFSYKSEADGFWVNLTNVDVAALPLALKGKTLGDKQDFSLGYKTPMAGIVRALDRVGVRPKFKGLSGPVPGLLNKKRNKALITCKSGQDKVVAPNILPDAYSSYDTYLQELMDAEAKLILHSDIPEGGTGRVYTGSFKKAVNPGDTIIGLKNGQETLEITKENFTSDIIYKCDGGDMKHNGKTVPQNQIAKAGQKLTDEQLMVNSIFRNLTIGMNEGYFSPDIVNRNANFPFMAPFQNGNGSQYAQVLNHNSNSYGFPYADSNLKVLIVADQAEEMTLTICRDDQAFGYDAAPPIGGNQIIFSDYEFGIGPGSQALGTIEMGNCRYIPDSNGAYGGKLPTLDDWFQMSFDFNGKQEKKHIWLKTTGMGSVVGANLLTNGPDKFRTIKFSKTKVLQWGAPVSWIAGKESPAKPTG